MNTDAKVLIVEDSIFMRSVLKKILEGLGLVNIIEAEDGKECLEKIKSEDPDLILLDMIIPEPTGMEILEQIGGKKAIIVVSSVGQEDIIEEAKELGAFSYITKPFENKLVEEEVKKALS